MYGMPVDSGPMAFYYDKEVFDKAGISEPPSTWDEFYQDAKKIKQIGSYITNDPGYGSCLRGHLMVFFFLSFY